MTDELEQEKPKTRKKRKKQVTGARFIGGRKFLTGVPARDHTAEEWAAYTEEEQKHFVNLGLFEVNYD